MSYRDCAKDAINKFRPILKALNIRDRASQREVFLAEGELKLNFLNFDECSILIHVGRIEAASMFLFEYTEIRSRAIIIINERLYTGQDEHNREYLKIAGVHEFIHFLAKVYLATTVGKGLLRHSLLHRLNDKIKSLHKNNNFHGEFVLRWSNLKRLHNILSGAQEAPGTNPPLNELYDSHFRIGIEEVLLDYYKDLFKNFLFSRELFENEYFNKTLQSQYRELHKTGRVNEANQLLNNALIIAANDKDIPLGIAEKQLNNWIVDYFKAA